MTIESKIIVSAGMPRSASTWLFNATRLLILKDPALAKNLCWGLPSDLDTLPDDKTRLVKTHGYDADLHKRSDYILYSYRDVRDAIASSVRKFGASPSIAMADTYIESFHLWTESANYTMRYESMLADKTGIIRSIASALALDPDNAAAVAAEIDSLSYDTAGDKNGIYNTENFLHQGHITDGRHGSWKGVLSDRLVKEIENKYADWLVDHEYPLTTR